MSGLGEKGTWMRTLGAGTMGGLIGGVVIWIYEALVWVEAQQIMPLSGIPANATGLVFGKAVQHALGMWAYALGTSIHFGFAVVWGLLFAVIWPYLRRHDYEATLIALFFAVLAWVVMHAAISVATSDHPRYTDPAVVIGGFMSHIFFAVPMALVVKKMLSASR